tara:strand:- start:1932 stop:2711 length:780 start_codon:yes stop_codon:yes gene_type:complete
VNYQIAIPSYKREKTIKEKTLPLLEKHNIDPKKIKIFVASQIEKLKYKESLKNTPYENNIVQGVPTIGMQRNFIENYYPEGEKLVMFDDDIDGVFVKNQDDLDPIQDLENNFIIKGFELCLEKKSNIFGLYAAANAYFMKHRIYEKLCYIPGGVFGIIVEHDPFLHRITNHGEDYEYSIRQYIKNGILIRFDDITIKSKFFREEGGLQTIRTKEYIYKSIKKIQDTFPEYCKMYIRKSSGNAELRLRDNSGNKKQEALF